MGNTYKNGIFTESYNSTLRKLRNNPKYVKNVDVVKGFNHKIDAQPKENLPKKVYDDVLILLTDAEAEFTNIPVSFNYSNNNQFDDILSLTYFKGPINRYVFARKQANPELVTLTPIQGSTLNKHNSYTSKVSKIEDDLLYYDVTGYVDVTNIFEPVIGEKERLKSYPSPNSNQGFKRSKKMRAYNRSLQKKELYTEIKHLEQLDIAI